MIDGIVGFKLYNYLAGKPEEYRDAVESWRKCAEGCRVEVRGYDSRGQTRGSLYIAKVCGPTDDSQLAAAADLWGGVRAFLNLEGAAVHCGMIERSADTARRVVEWVVSVNGTPFLRATLL